MQIIGTSALWQDLILHLSSVFLLDAAHCNINEQNALSFKAVVFDRSFLKIIDLNVPFYNKSDITFTF